ncbi:DUF3883 domain-containing protein [Gordonia amicalis]|uniref:DUF3883 domain-containing protein n=1 Tax=Gordonia amicalis TaxID=89053 RepID=A0AAE4R7W1_9ACTN|nr:DUF3883 domain-containing protein [Gordonia amicalis]MCZ0913079.1 DUF3883 domain-containing protein [Gordonia amicalis]MCZ4581327.1 DUF3883 domain-containing protein [Gordonia amicalis]MCZ4653875.1 DUF3883 domain-containing protein [Gordonia amicalis]MDJ0455341.1 DUF3883 domain-containing protein [Gordonia amicalis]MDV6307433.1 DUF3883 domain-containing protein [Gordonia amicalis]
MAGDRDWSRSEVEICVAEYLHLLTLQLNGQRVNKRERAAQLAERLNSRTRTSVEFKHCNISAAITELGYPSVAGYKPRPHIQRMLVEVVEEQLSASRALEEALTAAVQRPAVATDIAFGGDVWVTAPAPSARPKKDIQTGPLFNAVRRDYFAEEARNRSLGLAGELFVTELESRRLHAVGRKDLSKRVEHVAKTQGDGLGYDVLSFDADGTEKLIEVKTTSFDKFTPFYVTRNELARSNEDSPRFHLYRVFEFRDSPKVFDLPGKLTQHCHLDPATYLARVG